jgi:hypothetical protein
MKTPLILALAILSISQIATAQELPPIMSTKTYQKGIYRNYSEFVNNAPFIKDDFEIVTKNGDKIVEAGVANYSLKLNSTLKKKVNLKEIWGVSDGENIFINEYPNTFKYTFKKIHRIGRYCYFRGNPYYDRVTTAMVGGALAIAAYELEPDWPYIININNGQIFLLNKHLLEVILSKDTLLLAQYEEQASKRNYDTLFSYIDKYNALHVDEAHLDRKIKPIDVVFYRAGKKELDDSFVITVDGAVAVDMTTNKTYGYKSDDLDVTICIDKDCYVIHLTKNVTNYIECTWSNPAYRPQVVKVDQKVGEFHVNAAEHRARKTKK